MRIGIDAKLARDLTREREHLQAEVVLDHRIVARLHRILVLRIGIELLLLAQFLFRRAPADGQIDAAGFTVADQFDRDGRAGPDIGDKEGQRLFRRHILAVDLRHDVASLDAGLFGRFAGLDRLDEFTALLRNAQRCSQIVGHRLDLHTQITAFDFHAVTQLLHDRRGDLGGDGKADAHAAARRREDRVVDADDIALHVEQRTARIAAVDAGVGLDVAVVCAALSGDTLDGRNDAGRYRSAQAEGIADGHHPVARSRLTRIAEFDEGESLAAADLQHREIG